MSNKPRIYSHCKAGCSWETVHKDDFERSAAFIACHKVEGAFRLEPLKTYRVKKSTDLINSNYGFRLTLSYTVNGTEFTNDIYSPDNVPLMDYTNKYFNFNGSYQEFMTVRLCNLYLHSDNARMAVIEFDGELFYILILAEMGTITSETCENVQLKVTETDECYLVNEHAEILAQGLPEVTEEDNDKIMKVVNGVWAAVAEETYKGEVEVI